MPEPKPSNSIVIFSVPSTFAWQARRDFEPTPGMASSLSFSSRATFERPLRPSCTKMWQLPHLACPSHLWRMPISAPRSADNRLVPSPTTIVLPDGMTVSIDIDPFLVWLHILIDCGTRSDIDRGILHRTDDEFDLIFRQVGMKRQCHGAIRHLLGDEIIAAAIAELEIVPLQMQRIAVGRGLHLLHSQIFHDGIAAGAAKARPEMNDVEKPVHLGYVGADVRILDPLERLHMLVVEMLGQP